MYNITVATPEAGFREINRTLLFNDEALQKYGQMYASQRNLYDTLLVVRRAIIPDDWDFTKFINYRPQKWSSLVSNYLDIPYLQEVLSQVHHREMKKNRNYNISFHFTNNHDGGKGCLLTATFSRRPNVEEPIIIATVRASETVKRLMMDLMLLTRMGQAAWGEDEIFQIEIFFPYMWLATQWATLYIHYDKEALEMVEERAKGGSQFHFNVMKTYKEMIECKDPEKLTYHSMRRVVKVVQGDTSKPPVLAKDCQLPI